MTLDTSNKLTICILINYKYLNNTQLDTNMTRIRHQSDTSLGEAEDYLLHGKSISFG